MEARGRTRTVCVSDDAVTIIRKGTIGWSVTVPASECRIPLHCISAVHLEPSGRLGGGSLRLVVDGAERDENAVDFVFWHQAEFETLARTVANAIAARSHRTVAV
jgi:Domain of unknown function (DUF4429)